MRLAFVLSFLAVGCASSTTSSPPSGETSPPTSPPVSSATPSPAAVKPPGYVTLVANDGVLATATFPKEATSEKSLARGCSRSSIDDASRGAPESDDVGRIDIALPNAGARLVLEYDATKHSYADAFAGAIPVAGSAIGVKATTFETSLTAASAPELSAPAEGAAIADDGTDLAVAWSPTTEPLFMITIMLGRETITCNFDGASGAGSVPASLIHDAFLSAPATAQIVAIAGHTTILKTDDRDVYVTYDAVQGRTLAAPAH